MNTGFNAHALLLPVYINRTQRNYESRLVKNKAYLSKQAYKRAVKIIKYIDYEYWIDDKH